MERFKGKGAGHGDTRTRRRGDMGKLSTWRLSDQAKGRNLKLIYRWVRRVTQGKTWNPE
jgi:hypothetical protein